MDAIKKLDVTGATEYGGFGGIGVENWILQNGGSFVKAMQSFLDNTVDKNGKELGFYEFIQRYPIYDWGQNHRSISSNNDHYIEGLTEIGFDKLKTTFRDLLKSIEKTKTTTDKTDFLGDSIVDYTKRADKYTIHDISLKYQMIAQFRAKALENTPQELVSELGEK